MIVQQGLQRFAELVAERTDGELKVEIFPASQLGTEQEILEGVQLGTIHMFEGSAGSAGRFLPALEAFAHPFLWRDLDHMLTVARGDIGQELSQQMVDEHGMRILDMGWLFGQRHLTTASTPVHTPEDMEGLKIRVQPTTIYLEMIKAMGANPTPIDWKEVYLSLQTGVVDGQENPVGVIYSAKLFEVQNYLMLTGHIMQNQVVIINESFFHSLSPEHRQVLEDAVIEAGDYQNALIEAGAKEDLAKLKEAGMTVIEPDIEAFRAATADIYLQFEDQWGKGLFERMRAAGS
jgi:tripartite ATP-independent transporter DctP family solute receptor